MRKEHSKERSKVKEKDLESHSKEKETDKDVSFADHMVIGRTMVRKQTRKRPFGRLRKEVNGMKIGTSTFGIVAFMYSFAC